MTDENRNKFKEFFLLGYYCNKSLAKTYENLCELFKSSMSDGKITILLLENGYEPKVVEKFFKEMNPNLEKEPDNCITTNRPDFCRCRVGCHKYKIRDFIEECKSRGIY